MPWRRKLGRTEGAAGGPAEHSGRRAGDQMMTAGVVNSRVLKNWKRRPRLATAVEFSRDGCGVGMVENGEAFHAVSGCLVSNALSVPGGTSNALSSKDGGPITLVVRDSPCSLGWGTAGKRRISPHRCRSRQR